MSQIVIRLKSEAESCMVMMLATFVVSVLCSEFPSGEARNHNFSELPLGLTRTNEGLWLVSRSGSSPRSEDCLMLFRSFPRM